jgi:hypothetical protein
MKKLISKFLLFLLPFLVFFLVIEVFYRITSNNYTTKKDILIKKSSAAEILILGNSHTFYGLNPKYFNEKTINISNISQTIYFDKLIFDNYINEFKNLKFLILNIEYTSLSEIVNTKENSWRKFYYKHYMGLDVPTINKFELSNYFISNTRPFKNNLFLLNRFINEKTILDCDSTGFGNNYLKSNKVQNLIEDAKIRVVGHEDDLIDFSQNINRIQQIIEICKSKNIKVLLVTMPVSRSYAKGVNQLKLKKIFQTGCEFDSKNENVNYLNLFNDTRFLDDDFYDSDHLHSDGAKKCSIILNEFINRIQKDDSYKIINDGLGRKGEKVVN